MKLSSNSDKRSNVEKGYALEERVAATYRLLGADPVRMNLRLAGHQLDVYAEVAGPDGFSSRIGIDCKNYSKSVGVNEVTSSSQKLYHLRQSGHIDLPLLVSAVGFTPEAVNAAQALGVKTTTVSDLVRRVEDFSGYLRAAIKEYEGTKIFKRDLYRSLRCTGEAGQDLGYIDEYLPKWFSAEGQFLTLLGDYGTGKTTFAQRLLWVSARAYLEDPLNNRIPIFIPLKRYRKEVNIRSLIIDLLLHEYGVRLRDYSVFKSLNEAGRLLIILDAFDEMATGAEEAEVISNFREIKSLVAERSQVLLTCRTHFFKDQDQLKRVHAGTSLYREFDEGDKSHSLCFLSPFRWEDIEALVCRYEPSRAEDYLSAIELTYNLKELSRHPILLDMILTTVPEALRQSKLVTPSDLYSTYTSFWLDRDDWRTRMTHEQREFFMTELALYFQLGGFTEINFRDLPRYIRQKFPGLRTFRDLDYFEADIRTCTFLVRDQRGNYSFVHRSFCEYLAARCLLHHLFSRQWPNYLRKGQGRSAINWLTPETSRFLMELVDKRSRFESFIELFFLPKLDGFLIFLVLSIYKHSPQSRHRGLFDVAYALLQMNAFAGVDFRGQIADLAEALHSPNWRAVKAFLEKHRRAGDLRPIKFTSTLMDEILGAVGV